ncbi:MAG: PDZ domain-containing protein [Chitinophagaceae bacterium]|nr:PDZ domain-containing protein [Chitinophagaceae bacterium]MBK8952046.1 PDZ domain-containing protein [Chitinophagaceae bacterium]
MEKIWMKNSLLAAFAALLAPLTLMAQQDEKKAIEEKKKEVRQIIVTIDENSDKKTVIEIDGEKVTVNGKPIADYKAENGAVKIKERKVKDVDALSPDFPGSGMMFFRNGNNNFFGESMKLEGMKNKPMLGVTTEKTDKGVEVKDVTKESAAEKIGLKQGDIITKIDDKKIETPDDLSKGVQSHKPGDKVTVHYKRDGKEQKAEAELTQWKGTNAFGTPGQNFDFNFNFDDLKDLPKAFTIPKAPGVQNWNWSGGGPKLGLSVQDTEDGKGVKVIEVDNESNAAKAGVKENDIITQVDDKSVNSVDEIAKMLKEKKENLSVKLQVTRGNKSQTIEVKIPRKIKTADL